MKDTYDEYQRDSLSVLEDGVPAHDWSSTNLKTHFNCNFLPIPSLSLPWLLSPQAYRKSTGHPSGRDSETSSVVSSGDKDIESETAKLTAFEINRKPRYANMKLNQLIGLTITQQSSVRL